MQKTDVRKRIIKASKVETTVGKERADRGEAGRSPDCVLTRNDIFVAGWVNVYRGGAETQGNEKTKLNASGSRREQKRTISTGRQALSKGMVREEFAIGRPQYKTSRTEGKRDSDLHYQRFSGLINFERKSWRGSESAKKEDGVLAMGPRKAGKRTLI